MIKENPEQHPNETEKMILTASRKIMEKVKTSKYNVILAGIGASTLASWVAYYLLLKEGYEIDLMSEVGMYGYSPLLGDPFIFNLRNLLTCRMKHDTLTILGIFLRGCHGLGVLGAAQVDRKGNINTTLMRDRNLFITGSGGGNDVVTLSEEVIVVAEQDKRRFPERVQYITSPGENVTAVITQFGMYEKMDKDGELILTGVLGNEAEKEERCRLAKENCGWDLKIADKVKNLPDPSSLEISLLRRFDPDGYFLNSRQK